MTGSTASERIAQLKQTCETLSNLVNLSRASEKDEFTSIQNLNIVDAFRGVTEDIRSNQGVDCPVPPRELVGWSKEFCAGMHQLCFERYVDTPSCGGAACVIYVPIYVLYGWMTVLFPLVTCLPSCLQQVQQQ